MKGLELSQRYFEDLALPMLEREFPQLLAHMAAGLAGDGSECFGFDDTLSQDHDWGPAFCLWLPRDILAAHGARLERAMGHLPRTYLGFGPRETSQWGGGRVGALSMEDFFQTFTGLDRPPQSNNEWLAIPENALAACTNGRVFFDRLGKFSAWRERLLAFYPEDVRLKKIASRCMSLGQSGQYNYYRCSQREDVFGIRYSLVKFCSDALSMVFLLNRRYAPFYKWMARAARDLPILGAEMVEGVERLLLDPDGETGKQTVEAMSAMLIAELKNQSLTEGAEDFLADHGPRVQQHIQDPDLAVRNVWVG